MPRSRTRGSQPSLSKAAREPTTRSHEEDQADAASARESWEAYREWLSRVDAPRLRRRPGNRSVYSWQGYQSWARKVRRAMEGES